MKAQKVGSGKAAIVGFLAACMMVLVCGMVGPSRVQAADADEKTPKETLTEELPPGEAGAPGGPSFMDRLLFIADFDAFLTWSKLSGEETLSGATVNGLFAPVYQFNDRTFLILMYDGHYYRKREFYSDEEGSRERTEFQSHTIQPMVRFDFGDKAQYSLTPSVFHTATFNRDRETAGWRDGLYNYRDYGAGLDFDMRQIGGPEGTLSFGAQYYARKYPNYASLLSQTGLDLNGQQNVEKNEKDYHGTIAKAGYSWIQPLGLSWKAEYSFLFKRLDDKRVVDSNGVLTADKQRDYLHTLDLNFQYAFDIGGGLKLGLDLTGSKNDSNQNYWDEKIAGLFSTQKYTSDYYDYDSFRVRPSISYTFAMWPLTPSISYSYYRISYDERRAKYSNGDYKGEHHYEEQEAFVLGLQYDLTDNWSLLAQWENLRQRSNNEDERTYRYGYTMNTYIAGVSFKY